MLKLCRRRRPGSLLLCVKPGPQPESVSGPPFLPLPPPRLCFCPLSASRACPWPDASARPVGWSHGVVEWMDGPTTERAIEPAPSRQVHATGRRLRNGVVALAAAARSVLRNLG